MNTYTSHSAKNIYPIAGNYAFTGNIMRNAIYNNAFTGIIIGNAIYNSAFMGKFTGNVICNSAFTGKIMGINVIYGIISNHSVIN